MHIARELCGGPDLRHARRRHVPRPGDRALDGEVLPDQRAWMAEDRRKLLAFARDLLNSDYAGHRLTFQLFAQSPPFAHLAAVYRNFDFAGPLDLRAAAPPGCPSACSTRGGRPDGATTHTRIRPFNTQRHLPRAAARQRSLPGGRRRQHGLPARSGRRRISTRAESSAIGDAAARPSRRWRTSSCCSPRRRARWRTSARCTIYLADIRYREPVYRVIGALAEGRLPGLRPGSSCRRSRGPEWLVEIDVTAVICRRPFSLAA